MSIKEVQQKKYCIDLTHKNRTIYTEKSLQCHHEHIFRHVDCVGQIVTQM